MVAIRLLLRVNEWIALTLNRVLSWSIWVPALTLGSVFGVAIHQNDIVMLLLTIQTSVDAAATKVLQSHVRQTDEKRDVLLQETINGVKAQGEMLISMAREAERRDAVAAKRDRAILVALEALTMREEIIANGIAAKSRTRRRNKR